MVIRIHARQSRTYLPLKFIIFIRRLGQIPGQSIIFYSIITVIRIITHKAPVIISLHQMILLSYPRKKLYRRFDNLSICGIDIILVESNGREQRIFGTKTGSAKTERIYSPQGSKGTVGTVIDVRLYVAKKLMGSQALAGDRLHATGAEKEQSYNSLHHIFTF